jgi:phosphatidylserine decarboxylase
MAEGGASGFIAPPGYRFILAGVILIFLGLVTGWQVLTILGIAGAAFFTYFFRDPARPISEEPGMVVSPADGKVILVDDLREDRFLQAPCRRVAIFMNVFDVHVNRAPAAGTVALSEHRDGKFKAAFREDAGWGNEQQAVVLATDHGPRVLTVQIAGLLARRIISTVQPGQRLARGERIGMICFGSRVDLYLPPEVEVLVRPGDRVKAGSSVVARWS